MNKDRIQGSVEQAKGKVKEVAGKMTGDAKFETEGKTQQVAGKIQNAVGGSARPPQLAPLYLHLVDISIRRSMS